MGCNCKNAKGRRCFSDTDANKLWKCLKRVMFQKLRLPIVANSMIYHILTRQEYILQIPMIQDNSNILKLTVGDSVPYNKKQKRNCSFLLFLNQCPREYTSYEQSFLWKRRTIQMQSFCSFKSSSNSYKLFFTLANSVYSKIIPVEYNV